MRGHGASQLGVGRLELGHHAGGGIDLGTELVQLGHRGRGLTLGLLALGQLLNTGRTGKEIKGAAYTINGIVI